MATPHRTREVAGNVNVAEAQETNGTMTMETKKKTSENANNNNITRTCDQTPVEWRKVGPPRT